MRPAPLLTASVRAASVTSRPRRVILSVKSTIPACRWKIMTMRPSIPPSAMSKETLTISRAAIIQMTRVRMKLPPCGHKRRGFQYAYGFCLADVRQSVSAYDGGYDADVVWWRTEGAIRTKDVRPLLTKEGGFIFTLAEPVHPSPRPGLKPSWRDRAGRRRGTGYRRQARPCAHPCRRPATGRGRRDRASRPGFRRP